MSNQETSGITADDVTVDFGERVRKGYDPEAVDAHLRRIAHGVSDLQARLAESGEDEESLGLVLRATRRSVDEALAEARDKAAHMVAESEVKAARLVADADDTASRLIADAETRTAALDAEYEERSARLVTDAEDTAGRLVADAEETASRLVADAEETASRLVADAEARSAALDAETEERARSADERARERYAEIGRLIELREVELKGLDDEIERRQELLRNAGADLIRLADGFIDLREKSEADDPDSQPDSQPAQIELDSPGDPIGDHGDPTPAGAETVTDAREF